MRTAHSKIHTPVTHIFKNTHSRDHHAFSFLFKLNLVVEHVISHPFVFDTSKKNQWFMWERVSLTHARPTKKFDVCLWWNSLQQPRQCHRVSTLFTRGVPEMARRETRRSWLRWRWWRCVSCYTTRTVAVVDTRNIFQPFCCTSPEVRHRNLGTKPEWNRFGRRWCCASYFDTTVLSSKLLPWRSVLRHDPWLEEPMRDSCRIFCRLCVCC